MMKKIKGVNSNEILSLALNEAKAICEEDVGFCKSIGEHGLKIIEAIYQKKKDTVNILTHCNAGWLATIDWGTATSPIYHAHQKGIKVHVWVDETRPRNQGANLTSYELNEEGVPNTIIADNTGGILMQRGQVDMCIVGTDRTLSNGDVCNKIGTYLKALSAKDNNVPFYVALPSSTIDWDIKDAKDIPIEERNSEELSHIDGVNKKGEVEKVFVTGCLSERYKDDLEKEIPDVDRYFGTHHLPQLLRALGTDYKKELIGERLRSTPPHFAYVKIAE